MTKGWKRESARHALAARGIKTKFGKKLHSLQVHQKDTNVFGEYNTREFGPAYWLASKDSEYKGATVRFPKFKGMKFMDDYEMMMFHIWEENGIAQIGAEDNANQDIGQKKSLGKPLDELEEADVTNYVKSYVLEALSQNYADYQWDEMRDDEKKRAMNLGRMVITSLTQEAADRIKGGDVHD